MMNHINRRRALTALAAMVAAPSVGFAQTADVWSVGQTYDGLITDQIRLIDIRSRAEWSETGIAEGAWPISLHEDRFSERLFAARELAGGRPVALTCATGGRSGSVMRSLRQAGYSGFIDVSEGMLGSSLGPGWIAAGLPIVDLELALATLPEVLA